MRVLIPILLIALCVVAGTVSSAHANEDAFLRARAWLEGQIVPYGEGGALIASYSDSDSSRAYIYDQALAIIAFTMLTDYARARVLIRGLIPLVAEDGSLDFYYNTVDPKPNPQALLRTGAIAWVGYAVGFYLDASHDKVNRTEFLTFAVSLARYARARQIRKVGDRRQGLLTGGRATVRLQMVGKEVEQVYVPGALTWCSVEHNVDAYFFFSLLAKLTGNPMFAESAREIGRALLEIGWEEGYGQFIRGVNMEEGRDRVLALDCASWGGIFLLANGRDTMAARSLESIEERYASQAGDIRGYKAYYKKRIYENYLVSKTMFPDDPRKDWTDIEAVWPEGTMGVCTLLMKMGQLDRAAELLGEVEKMQGADGGILYHSMIIPFEFEMNPSVASTAWYLMNRLMLWDSRVRDWFWAVAR